ncbi:MAG: hypothetical protein R3293_26125, partial [Candidatus Promineifilaceae bacterium]|nr:hypothetical protein [Candidatus Promineifilaceae bacterium]
DPELASEVANNWAEQFVVWANRTYGDSSEDQLLFFEQQLASAAQDLQLSEDALVEYQAENRSAILDNELQALRQTHANLLAKKEEIELLAQDLESLRAASGGAAANDQLAALILTLRAFNSSADNESTPPLQLQVNTDTVFSNGGADTERQVENLQAALQIQAEKTETALVEIEPQILAVQRERQEAQATESLLVRNVELAKDTHTALARTVEEKRITSQDTNTGASLASRSAVPTSPIGPRKTLNALAAFLGVSLLVVLIIILVTWWNPGADSTHDSSEEIDSTTN